MYYIHYSRKNCIPYEIEQRLFHLAELILIRRRGQLAYELRQARIFYRRYESGSFHRICNKIFIEM